MLANPGKLSSGLRTGKGQFSFQSQRKTMPNYRKECSNYRTIALISHASKVMLKILQASLQKYVNQELPDVQAGFRKGRGTRDQIANIHWITKKSKSSRKTSTSALLTMPKSLCGSQQTLENSERDGNTRPPDLPLRNLYADQE